MVAARPNRFVFGPGDRPRTRTSGEAPGEASRCLLREWTRPDRGSLDRAWILAGQHGRIARLCGGPGYLRQRIALRIVVHGAHAIRRRDSIRLAQRARRRVCTTIPSERDL